ncbi:MAG: acetyl-coenzyme A synthetase [halophilic archaeon J07HX64]|jgi:acetyl-coenzyme A synthetase (EC 6.2.1.1)|nr:MAG: acetyl-coenzyme A synthetase [halophilic archaeon J07HX64]
MSEEPQLEARLESQEEFEPPASFVEQANVTDESIYREFEENWPEAWERAAELLDWEQDWDQVLDDSDEPFYEWFVDGKLNACANCVDRHLGERADQTAIEWVGEPGGTRTYSYAELHEEVNAAAAALRELGVEEDDVVTMYMPMIPELPIAMLACARIGAPHSVVFAGFSANALAERMQAADSEVLVTCDGYYRRGDALDHLSKAREGLEQVEDVTTVVAKRLGADAPSAVEDEHVYESVVDPHRGTEVDPVTRDAEDMLFLMYTSGTTGEPKGVKHTTGGYLSYTAWTSRAVLDIDPEDNYWCAADIGWITGHSYIVYGPLALGTTTLMYEGTPDYPEKDRLWELVDSYDVTQLYTAPTAIRAFMKWGTEYPERHDLSTLRLLGTVGEPINPRAWRWYHEHIGDGSCPIVDTWWQTETGGMMITTLPGIGTMKPGTAGPPLPGISADVVDTDGTTVDPGEGGYLTVDRPWPGMLRTLYRNDERFLAEYWQEHSDTENDNWVYSPEDGAKIDDDGYITILGRVDDVVNVSGHRIGTMEVESAIVGVEGVAEAAVVGADDDVKGQAIYAYAITEAGQTETDEFRREVIAGVEDAIGPFARPAEVVFTPELPKTRSGKIMRRLLADIADGEELGNTSTLRNPGVVEDIQQRVQERETE